MSAAGVMLVGVLGGAGSAGAPPSVIEVSNSLSDMRCCLSGKALPELALRLWGGGEQPWREE